MLIPKAWTSQTSFATEVTQLSNFYARFASYNCELQDIPKSSLPKSCDLLAVQLLRVT